MAIAAVYFLLLLNFLLIFFYFRHHTTAAVKLIAWNGFFSFHFLLCERVYYYISCSGRGENKGVHIFLLALPR